MERPGPARPARPYRSVPCRRRRRQPLAVPFGRRPRAPVGRQPLAGGRGRACLRPVALSFRLDRRGLRARRAEDLPDRGLVLHAHRGRGHCGAADRAHGHRRAFALAPWAVGTPSGQPARAHDLDRRGLVVARPRLVGRSAGWQLVVALPRVRERVLDARPPVPDGPGALHPRWLVRNDRRRPVAADRQARGGRGAAARHGAVRRFLGAARPGQQVGVLPPRRGRGGSRPRGRRRPSACRQGRCPVERLAPAGDGRRPQLPFRMRYRDRARRPGGDGPVL